MLCGFSWPLKACVPVFVFFFQLCHTACGILVPQSWIKSMCPALEMWNLNHWTAREVPVIYKSLMTPYSRENKKT